MYRQTLDGYQYLPENNEDKIGCLQLPNYI